MYREMKVSGITIDPLTNVPIIILKDLEEKSALPIWIGLLEASAIATQLENVSVPRPLTHDLIKNIFDDLNISIEKVVISDLRENTFYALICLVSNGNNYEIDSRPSDAIAIALRTSSPIYVHESVLEKSRVIDLTKKGDKEVQDESQKWADILEDLKPEDFGKYKM